MALLSLALLPALAPAAEDDGPSGDSFTLIWSIIETLPNDSRRYLIVGALLATILLLVRHQPARRAPNQRKGKAAAGRNIAVAKPSYPSDVTMIPGLKTSSKSAFGIPDDAASQRKKPSDGPQGRPAPEPPQDPTVTGEMDFSTLHKKAIDAPRPAKRSKPAEELPDLLDFDDDPPASGGSEEPEFFLDDDDPMLMLDGDADADANAEAAADANTDANAEFFDDDDPMLSLDGDPAGDASRDAAAFDDDDPLFDLDGDAPASDGAAVDDDDPILALDDDEPPVPETEDPAVPEPVEAEALPPLDEALAEEPVVAAAPEPVAPPAEAPEPEPEPAPAAAPAAPRLKARVVIPRRAHEALPTLAFIDCDGLAGPTVPSDADDSGPRSIVDVVCRLLANKAPPADVLAFRIGEAEAMADETAAELAARLRADGHDLQRFRVLVDLDVAEADVSRMRAFSRALTAEGFGFGLTGVEPRNRLPMVVKMTEAVLLRFDAAAIDAALDTDAGVDQLARVAATVRERQAHVALRTALPDGRQRLLEARGQGLRWEYLEAPKAAG